MGSEWFNDIVALRYNDIRASITRLYYAAHGLPLNEDIFHDTLIKSSEKLTGEPLSYDKLVGYIYFAYKNNILREKLYARNKYNVDLDYIPFDHPDYDKNEYFQARNEIEEYVNANYGEEVFEAFARWLIDGYSVKQLESDMNISFLKYKFNKIKQYIKLNYDKQILYDITDNN